MLPLAAEKARIQNCLQNNRHSLTKTQSDRDILEELHSVQEAKLLSFEVCFYVFFLPNIIQTIEENDWQ